MIVFRQVDPRYPFLWSDPAQSPGRWHAEGEGPAHYFADTPDGAWAEFLRHEEITDPEDVPTIRRALWAVEIEDREATTVSLPSAVLTGGLNSYPRCQAHARDLRARGARRLVAPSAALLP
ncbi:MAG: RES domain-containing protein, partial [Vicinamibacterales bacterium]